MCLKLKRLFYNNLFRDTEINQLVAVCMNVIRNIFIQDYNIEQTLKNTKKIKNNYQSYFPYFFQKENLL